MSLFKVGDRVATVWGDGIVSQTDHRGDYPVVVKLDDDSTEAQPTFTADGLGYFEHRHPTVWHKKTGSAPVVGEGISGYPIYKRHVSSDLAVKFVALHRFIVINDAGGYRFGEEVELRRPHTDSNIWEDL